MVGAIADEQGEDAESRVQRHQDEDTVPGDHANPWVNVVKIIAEAAEKQEDRDMQNSVDTVHKPLDVESIKALKQIRSYPPALVGRRTGIGVLHEFVAPLLDKTTCYDTHDREEETDKE